MNFVKLKSVSRKICYNKLGDVMKKKFLIILLLLFAIFTTGCENNYLKNIDYNNFKEKVESKESFIVEVIQTGCSACKNFTPKFRKILNQNKVTAYQLNYSDLKEEEKKEFDSTFSISATPSVLFITEGEEKSVLTRIIGAVEKDKIVDKLKTNGYIK